MDEIATSEMQAVVDSIDSVAVIYDRHGVVTLANPFAEKVLGLQPSGMSREAVYASLEVRDAQGSPVLPAGMPAMRAALGERVSRQQLTIKNAHGAVYKVHASAHPVFFQGQMTGTVSVWTDVTEQERLREEQALLARAHREQDLLFERLVQQAPVGICVVSVPDSIIRLINPVLRKIVPGQADPTGRKVYEVWPQVEREMVAVMAEVVQTGEARHGTGKVPLLDDQGVLEERYFDMTFSPLISEHGRVTAVLGITHEITGLVNARHEAEAQRTLLEGVLQAMPAAVWVVDPDGQIIERNRLALDLIANDPSLPVDLEGYGKYRTRDPKTGQPITPAEMPLSRALATGESVMDVELEVFLPGRGPVVLLSAAAPIYDSTGALAGGVAVAQDITSRKAIEQELARANAVLAENQVRLRESESRFRTLAEATFEGIVVSQAGIVVEANGQFARMHGYTVPEVIGMAAEQFIAPHERERVSHNILGQDDTTTRFTALRKDGSERLFEAHGKVMQWHGQAVSVAAMRDITEQVLAENALRRSEAELRISEARYRQLIEFSPDTIFVQQDRVIVFINPAGLHMFGASDASEIVGRPVMDFIYPDDHEIVDRRIATIYDERQPVPLVEERFVRLDGSYVWTEAVAAPLLYNDRPAALVIVRDIHQRKMLEDERIESLAEVEIHHRLLENRERERQEIARDLHDGPIQDLMSTLFNIQFAREAINDTFARAELEQIGQGLKSAVRELRNICNDLRPPSLIRFGLSRAIQVAAEDFRDRHPEISLEMELVEGEQLLPEPVAVGLFRIFQEAMNNIARHSGANKVSISCTFHEGALVLEVHDNGCGFEPPGERFSQVEGGHYGLVGMRERAEGLGARLTITSLPGEGTTVRVELPA